MQRCLRAHWQFMIVLKDKDLPTVWEEFRALRPRQLPTLQQDWGRRQQHFSWVNDIEYAIFGRVEMWRGGDRFGLSVSVPFV